jgi:hypothetical protein
MMIGQDQGTEADTIYAKIKNGSDRPTCLTGRDLACLHKRRLVQLPTGGMNVSHSFCADMGIHDRSMIHLPSGWQSESTEPLFKIAPYLGFSKAFLIGKKFNVFAPTEGSHHDRGHFRLLR